MFCELCCHIPLPHTVENHIHKRHHYRYRSGPNLTGVVHASVGWILLGSVSFKCTRCVAPDTSDPDNPSGDISCSLSPEHHACIILITTQATLTVPANASKVRNLATTRTEPFILQCYCHWLCDIYMAKIEFYRNSKNNTVTLATIMHE